MSQTALITHPVCSKHEMGSDHPECPERLAAINDALVRTRLMDLLRVYDAQPVKREQLLSAHEENYVDSVFAAAPESGDVALDPDTSMNVHSLEAARLAAGAVVQACDLVMRGEMKSVFCAVRPPGHHAEHNRAMGFCIFNNVAVGVRYALEKYGLERVAVIDFDVHHGNGTEDIFADEPRVFFCSSFQYPFFPFSYGPSIAGQRVNVRLPAGCESDAFRQAIETEWLPALNAFKPQLIFISAGFDAHRLDPLANLRLSEADFAWITQELKSIAEQHAQGRIISSLEGGYHLDALGDSVVAHISAMMGV